MMTFDPEQQHAWLTGIAIETRDSNVAAYQSDARLGYWAAGILTALSVGTYNVGDDVARAFGYSEETAALVPYVGATALALLVGWALLSVIRSTSKAQNAAQEPLRY